VGGNVLTPFPQQILLTPVFFIHSSFIFSPPSDGIAAKYSGAKPFVDVYSHL